MHHYRLFGAVFMSEGEEQFEDDPYHGDLLATLSMHEGDRIVFANISILGESSSWVYKKSGIARTILHFVEVQTHKN